MPLPSWQVFDRIRAFFRHTNYYRIDSLYQDQTDINRITTGANFLELTRASGLLDQTNLQINRLERYKDYDMMDEVGEITLALDIYADESSLIDSERKHAVIVKAKSKQVKERVEDLFYNTLLIDRDLRPIVRYLCKYGDFPAEVVLTKNRDGVASLRFINVYNFTRLQTKFGDLVGFFYQDPNTMAPQFLHPWQVLHLRLTSYESAYHPYGRCQDINGPIWTPYGYKKLKDIQKGDLVYSFDLENQKPVVTKVLDKVISGIKNTLIINTKHRSIRVTPEHPILAIIKNNYKDERVLVNASDRNQAHYEIKHERDIKTKKYVLAKDLIKGDKLVLPKLHNTGIMIPIEKYKIEKHAGKKMSIPDFVNNDFAKLMGFLIGDGWIPTSNYTQLCFAEGEYKEINDKYINIIKSFGYEQDPVHENSDNSNYGYYKFNSIELSQTIAQMGLVGKCYDKRIPKWVFLANNDIKKAFIEGLIDSDGSSNTDEWNCERFQIELTSEELIRDIKVLLDQMNIKCSNISKRNRPIMTTIIHGEEYKRHDSWILYWYNAKMSSGDLLHFGKRRTKYDNSSDDYLVETIISIEDGGEVEVGDIQVSEHHNFISNGVVIHNSIIDGSRKDFKRLRLMEDAALIYRVCLVGDTSIWTPTGHIKIKYIRPGDIVYSQSSDGRLTPTRVTHQVSNGIRDVYTVSTKYRQITGTATHPFLIRDLSDDVLKYIDLQDLNPEWHLLVSPKIGGEGRQKQIKLWSDNEYGKLTLEQLEQFRNTSYNNITEIMRKVDHPIYLTRQVLYLGKGMPIQKLITLCELLGLDPAKIDRYVPHCGGGSTLPSISDKDFARFVGFFLGDGYLTDINWRVGLALGVDQDINKRYIEHYKRYHQRVKLEYKNIIIDGAKIKRLNTAVVCDKQLYMTFVDLGLIGGAHSKRIPGWVYELPLSHKIEFILGLIDADGTIRTGASGEYYELELCNRELLEDIKILCEQIGWIAGNIRTRTREGGLEHMNGEYTSYNLYINPESKVGYEKITEIEYVGQQEVFDISVEHENHNFVANGVTVHNTRAPEKRMFSIPVGNIPNTQVYHYITQIARQFKKHKFVDPATGQVNERYAPLIQEDDFFLPKRPGGEGPTIETLPGAQNLDQIEDILYFKKKMIAGTKIPFSRVGIGEQTESDTRSVASSSPEFAKAVQWVQREVAIGLKKIAIIDLALRGFSVEEIKDLDLTMTAASAIDELYRIETWNTRSEVISNLKESGLFTDEWILGRFTDMTKDEIAENQINRAKQAEKEAKAGGEEVAAPPGLSLGEAVDDEDKMLIMEYNDLIKNGGIRQYREAEKVFYTPDASWYVNQNELDGLTNGKGSEIVSPGTEKTMIDEVCTEVKKILDPSLNNQENEEIKIISQKMLPQEQQLIAEEQSDAKIH